MLLDVAWNNIDRAMPYVGWLSSESGQVKLALVDDQQNIQVATVVRPNEKEPCLRVNMSLNWI